MGQGGRLRLHAETTSRGSEPVDGPTRSQKTELEGAQSAEASKGARVSKLSPKPKASKPSKLKSVKQAKGAVRAVPVGVRPVAPKDAAAKEVAAPPAPPRRPAFYEALAVYETGVRALQRHDFEAAADSLRGVIQRYPGERELVERARLYLQVCERETARRPSGPQTPSESVYAATVALNAGDVDGALGPPEPSTRASSGQRPRALYYGSRPS